MSFFNMNASVLGRPTGPRVIQLSFESYSREKVDPGILEMRSTRFQGYSHVI